VQIGNSIFWVAYQALVSDVAGDGSRERWFALATVVRTAGWAVGGVVAGVVVAVGGRSGYVFVAAANAASFAVSAALMWRPLDGPDRERTERASGREDGRTGWSSVVRDRPFLGFVDANVGLTLLSLAFALGLPVFLVRTVGLPTWTPGAVLAINAVPATLGTPLIVRWITGHGRRGGPRRISGNQPSSPKQARRARSVGTCRPTSSPSQSATSSPQVWSL
jgi:MFS family permease